MMLLTTELLGTTTRGLEDISLKEIEELTGRRGWVEHPGLIGLQGGMEEAITLNLFSRSLYRIYLILMRSEFETLDDIYEMVYSLRFSDLIGKEQSFAVRSERQGEHGFASLDISRVIGQAIIDSFMRDKGIRLRVDLESPDVIFRAEVRNRRIWFGLDTTGKDSLAHRNYRVYNHPASLKPPIAYSLVRLSGWNPEENLLDPMCGSGTILIEAGRYALNIPNSLPFSFLRFPFFKEGILKEIKDKFPTINRELRLFGYDISPKHIEGALMNAERAGIRINLMVADARIADLNYERVVLNPPYGIRMGSYKKIEGLYRDFALNLNRSPGWKSLVIITPFSSLLLRHLDIKPSLSLEVTYCGLYTKALLFRR